MSRNKINRPKQDEKIRLAWAMKQVRKEILGMTLDQMQDVTGIKKCYLSVLERAIKTPLASTIFKLERSLGEGYIYKVYNFFMKAEDQIEWIRTRWTSKNKKLARSRVKRRINAKIKKIQIGENNA